MAVCHRGVLVQPLPPNGDPLGKRKSSWKCAIHGENATARARRSRWRPQKPLPPGCHKFRHWDALLDSSRSGSSYPAIPKSRQTNRLNTLGRPAKAHQIPGMPEVFGRGGVRRGRGKSLLECAATEGASMHPRLGAFPKRLEATGRRWLQESRRHRRLRSA